MLFLANDRSSVEVFVKIGPRAVGTFSLWRLGPGRSFQRTDPPAETPPSSTGTFLLKDPFLDAAHHLSQTYELLVTPEMGSGVVSVSLKLSQGAVALQALDLDNASLNGTGPFGSLLLDPIEGVGRPYSFGISFP